MAFRGGIWIHASIHLWFWGSFFWPRKDEPIFGFESFCSLPNTRKLEDKLIQHHIEFRSFFLPMDLTGLHHNRDMPAGFTLYLCVSDATLPSKGTAHRANRGASKAGDGKHKCFYHNISWGPGVKHIHSPFKIFKGGEGGRQLLCVFQALAEPAGFVSTKGNWWEWVHHPRMQCDRFFSRGAPQLHWPSGNSSVDWRHWDPKADFERPPAMILG